MYKKKTSFYSFCFVFRGKSNIFILNANINSLFFQVKDLFAK